MRVKYFKNIIERLLAKGLSQTKIAESLGFKKQNITEILQGIRQDMQGEHLSRLVKLCKVNRLEPDTWNKLGKMIDDELDGRK
jgi:transcriptional regulator with XRE-family HTH domain